jgi:hypothetical protein
MPARKILRGFFCSDYLGIFDQSPAKPGHRAREPEVRGKASDGHHYHREDDEGTVFQRPFR